MWWVMCFWYQIGLPSGGGPTSAVRDLAPIGRLRGDHLFAHRMDEPGGDEIGGVERLVADRAVAAVPKERIIAVEMLRGPDHMAMRTAAARALISALRSLPRPPAPCTAARSRRVIGPEASSAFARHSPIGRPSIRATGVRPANVPVVKASSAP